MAKPFQVGVTEPEAGMPPYMESFLSLLRTLVGVPFDYLVPDARLLPDESIRFFYLDRSWTDRLVDGAVAVGKIGTREQAHHQAHAASVHQQLDQTERIVRTLQIKAFADFDLHKKDNDDNNQAPGKIVTGFLLRSAAVTGWPHMDVRAYDIDVPERSNPDDPNTELDPGNPDIAKHQLKTLRLELLSPSVMLALFEDIPQLVYLEEPHHGVQFGILDPQQNGNFSMYIRNTIGQQIDQGGVPQTVPVPVRASNPRVIHVAGLRDRLQAKAGVFNASPNNMPQQNGSANFAVEVLQPPWRQRFEGTVDHAGEGGGDGRFIGGIMIAKNVQNATIQDAYKELLLNP
jgi:hypothetical protein